MSFGGALRALAWPSGLARRLHLSSLPLRRASWVVSAAPNPVSPFYPAPFRAPWEAFTGASRSIFTGLTDTRYPKRRPGMAPRRKRASLRPSGPYAWVQSVPGEPMPRSQPNKGSIKARGRKKKKRIKQQKAFILSEKKKRKVQYAEARQKKNAERIERKMAAVAREKAWAQRLIELQQLEAAKKAAAVS